MHSSSHQCKDTYVEECLAVDSGGVCSLPLLHLEVLNHSSRAEADATSFAQALLFVTRSSPAISPEEVPLIGPEYPSPATLLRLQVLS